MKAQRYQTHWFAGAMVAHVITYYTLVFIGTVGIQLPEKSSLWFTVLLILTSFWCFRETAPLIIRLVQDGLAGKLFDDDSQITKTPLEYFVGTGIQINFGKRNDWYCRGGFVYLLMDMNVTGYCKIGKTKEPAARIGHFDTMLPFETEVLHIIPCHDNGKTENVLHHRFADKRIRGEWFKLDKQDIEWIKQIETA